MIAFMYETFFNILFTRCDLRQIYIRYDLAWIYFFYAFHTFLQQNHHIYIYIYISGISHRILCFRRTYTWYIGIY